MLFPPPNSISIHKTKPPKSENHTYLRIQATLSTLRLASHQRMWARRLLERDTQALGTHAGRFRVLRLVAVVAAFTPLLDLVLAFFAITYTPMSAGAWRLVSEAAYSAGSG